ncbi:MAG: metallophosphoesterase [Polyangiaceae bacterium]
MRLLVAFTALVNLPCALGVAEAARRIGFFSPLLAGSIFFVIGVGLFPGRAKQIMNDHKRSAWEVRFVDLPFYVHWCACIFAIIPAVIAAIMGLLFFRALPTGVFMWLYVIGLIFSTYGVLIRRAWFVTKKIEIPIDGLDPKLDGFRIVQLSDLHVGALTPRSWVDRWVTAANRCDADIAVVTGDMVTSGVDFHSDIADGLGALTARSGVYVSMGNHDYFGEGEPLIGELRARGIRVLRNEGETIERAGASLYLAAIDDTWTRRDDLERALEGRPEGMSTVLLAHDPERFPKAADRDVALTLSGHTHGGQIAMPFFWRWISLAHLSHHYVIDLYKQGRSWLYVHPGLGTTGPPIRFGIAPAVVLLTLRAV